MYYEEDRVPFDDADEEKELVKTKPDADETNKPLSN
ncbi:hypothetical protein DFP95_101774 [Cohnella lupini]|uniref:Uncharacterized protein n=1 Tax=Cohnella lupini TaxID=1294267 RepID=A0A3D9IX33_9BACL|nr:hypothetical protein DFP95_101774 [Cohnella lupini]